MDSHYITHIMIIYNIFTPLTLFFFAFKQRIDFNFFHFTFGLSWILFTIRDLLYENRKRYLILILNFN